MPQNTENLQVFLASPGDLNEERKVVKGVIEEVNEILASIFGIRLELMSWETSVRPAFGEDPQDIINKQIGDTYDIFIGLLWSKIGTPTPRAESGTLEEFERAYTRHKQSPGSVELMVYFKEAPLIPSQIDALQIAKIQAFQRSLGPKGGLYWTFEDVASFEALLRIHLSKVVKEWADRTRKTSTEDALHGYRSQITKENLQSKPTTPAPFSETPSGIESEENIDYFEIFALKLGTMNEATAKITDATNKYNDDINAETNTINSASATLDKVSLMGIIKESVVRVGNFLDLYSDLLEENIILFSEARVVALNALSKGLLSLGPKGSDETETLQILDDVLSKLLDAHLNASKGLVEFRMGIAGLPRSTVAFNASKQKVLSSMDKLFGELNLFRETTESILVSISDIDHKPNR